MSSIKASILLILLKCIVLGFSNGNTSFTSRLFSNYGSLNMLFYFFDISFILWCFLRDFFQKVYETILFQLKFQKSISRYSILQKVWMSNFVILKWRHLPVYGAHFTEIKICWHFEFSWIKYFGNDFSFFIK